MESQEHFPKHLRLIRSQDFVDCKAHGKRRASVHLIIWLKPNERDHPRLGLAVSRKVGKAHDRNLIKRRMRELFRRGAVPVRPGYDYVVVAKDNASELDFEGLKQEMTGLLDSDQYFKRKPRV